MPDFWMMLGLGLTALLSIFGGLAIREGHDLMPHFAAWIVKALARRMPGEPEERQMYAEIWTADLEKVPGKMLKLGWALGLLHAPWNAWRDEYECSPLMIRLAIWSKTENIRFWLQVFPASPPVTPMSRGRQTLMRLSLSHKAVQLDGHQILQGIREMKSQDLRAGGLYLLLAAPSIQLQKMVHQLINMPGVGVPTEHLKRLNALIPVHLTTLVEISSVAHEDDPLFKAMLK